MYGLDHRFVQTLGMVDSQRAPEVVQEREWWRRLTGRREQWHLHRPDLRAPRPHRSWIGPTVVLATLLVSWYAMAVSNGPNGDAESSGLTIGIIAMMLMAWSFVLAVRIRPLEPLFGGLDKMYRVHRWIGALSVAAAWWHTSAADIDDGFTPASESVADAGEGLAGWAYNIFIVLLVLSLLRWMPYRWWRLTHKFFGLAFAFAVFHVWTIEKNYANFSLVGWWFNAIFVAGLVAFAVRVVGFDMVSRGLRYRVASAEQHGSSMDLHLEPVADRLQYEPGQFAVIKVQRKGLSEPHIFTIAAPPDEPHLRFFVRRLGDWTERLFDADLVGSDVLVEGPYGEFELLGKGAPTVWVGGGVGVTPFLSASTTLPADDPDRPVFFYCVHDRDDAMGMHVLQEAVADGRLELVLVVSSEGKRFGKEMLIERFGVDGLRGSHVALCGPASLVNTARAAALEMGATAVESEDFDIRQGFGPDLPDLPARLRP